MKNTFLLLLSIIMLFWSCDNEDESNSTIPQPVSDYRDFGSFNDFEITLKEIVSTQDLERIETFLDSLKVNNQIPFIYEDSVMFIYNGNSNSVSWAGDFNGWDYSLPGNSGTNLANSDIWILVKTFPRDARLDYKIVKNGSSWILDPGNMYTQVSGFGPNSELRMPNWEYPQETILGQDVVKGDLSDNILISSMPSNLGYDVQYKVYTPYNYSSLDSMPVIYITDGHEYSNPAMGAVVTVLDNLIYHEQIEPLIAVFIDPRDPGNTSLNRRGDEYTANIEFANFVADELVFTIDNNFKTKKNPDARAILGTSLGGWNSAYFGLKRSDVFRKLIIHSPAFDSQIINDFQTEDKLPLDIFMSTGVINDTEDRARSMKSVLEGKSYNLLYVEVNEGHSWGNWRALIDDPLLFLFPK